MQLLCCSDRMFCDIFLQLSMIFTLNTKWCCSVDRDDQHSWSRTSSFQRSLLLFGSKPMKAGHVMWHVMWQKVSRPVWWRSSNNRHNASVCHDSHKHSDGHSVSCNPGCHYVRRFVIQWSWSGYTLFSIAENVFVSLKVVFLPWQSSFYIWKHFVPSWRKSNVDVGWTHCLCWSPPKRSLLSRVFSSVVCLRLSETPK